MYANFLQPDNLEPTTIVANNRPSLADNISINNLGRNVSSGNLINKLSVHMPSFVIVKDILKKKRINKVKIRDMKNFFKETFSKDLDERKSLDLLKRNSVDEMFKEFQNKFVEIADKNAPKKTLSKLEKNWRRNRESLKASSSVLKERISIATITSNILVWTI